MQRLDALRAQRQSNAELKALLGDPKLRKIPEDDPSTVLARLFAGVREYATGAPQADDITAMVLTYEP